MCSVYIWEEDALVLYNTVPGSSSPPSEREDKKVGAGIPREISQEAVIIDIRNIVISREPTAGRWMRMCVLRSESAAVAAGCVTQVLPLLGWLFADMENSGNMFAY